MARLSRGIAPEIEERIEDFLDISDEEINTSLYQKLNSERAAHESDTWNVFILQVLLILACGFVDLMLIKGLAQIELST